MKNAFIPTNTSLYEFARAFERDGVQAFEGLQPFQAAAIVDRLATPDDVETLEEFETLADDMLETLADNIAPNLERCEENARDYMESQDNLSNYWECMHSELTLNAESIRERLAELLGDAITLEEFEFLAGEIAAGMHDGIAPHCPAPEDNAGPLDRRGPFGFAYDIWERRDALITLANGGDWQAFPVDDATERRLGEFLDLYNRLDALTPCTPRRDALDMLAATIRDGAEYGLDAFAVMVDEPEQILFYVDVESIAESLATYRAERLEETRERLEAQRDADERELTGWPLHWREFLFAYREALAWSTHDEYNGEEYETLEAFEFGEQACQQTRADCLEFIRRGAYRLEDIARAVGYSWARAGHDFWMTRAGHGVGFWDRDELTPYPDAVEFVCSLCDEFGEQWPYIGDDDNGDAVIYVK